MGVEQLIRQLYMAAQTLYDATANNDTPPAVIAAARRALVAADDIHTAWYGAHSDMLATMGGAK